MILKGQTAITTPFDPIGTSLISTDTESAIKEVSEAAFNSSKGFLLAQYNGNANTGRYLEFFPGIASNEAPILVPNPYKGITIVARTSATNATCAIRVADISTGSPVALYDITFNAVKQVIASGSPSSPLFTTGSNAQIAIFIQSGSISKPHLYIVGQGG
jgi:hypothetical protein